MDKDHVQKTEQITVLNGAKDRFDSPTTYQNSGNCTLSMAVQEKINIPAS